MKLWRHVLFGTNSAAEMIVGYAKAKLPGDPRAGIQSIINVLQTALDILNKQLG